jgi:hypothetical protein
MSPVAAPPISTTTAAAQAFVAAHLALATALGERLATLVGQPDEYVAVLEAGFGNLADPAYVEGSRCIAPGLREVVGVRLPLMEAAHKAFKRGTRHNPTSPLLDVVDRLLGNRYADIRWFGMWDLERLLPTDPERTWQLMRRAAHDAGEWITVDTLAHPYGAGILADARRWAELDQLVFSPSRWERRLVGSTLATMPHGKARGAGDKIVLTRGMALIEQLIGDAEPDVQKALSWALRTFAQLDPEATTAFLEGEAQTARRDGDGNRAWVVRDSLSKLPAGAAAGLRATLEGVRRVSGGPSSSRAAVTAAEFAPSKVVQGGPSNHPPSSAPSKATGRNSAP